MKKVLCLLLFFALAGCGNDENGPVEPGDDDDQIFNELPQSDSCRTSSHGNNDQDNCRLSKPGLGYGLNVKVDCDGTTFVVPNGAERTTVKGYLWKPVGNTGNAVIVSPPHVPIGSCTVDYKKPRV